MKTKKLSRHDFSKLIEKAKILEKCNFGEKILLTPDEKIIKIFYRSKRHFFFLPYYSHAKKFIRKAQALHQYKIDTLTPESLYYCPENHCDIVIYPIIPGISLRNLVAQGNREVLKDLAEFIAYLHRRNIYFKAGHLGNFIHEANGRFALIDVANLRFSINLRRRAKSIAFLLQRKEDRKILKQYGYETFIQHYLNATELSPQEIKKIRHYLDEYLR